MFRDDPWEVRDRYGDVVAQDGDAIEQFRQHGVTGDGEDHAIVDAVLRLASGLGLAAIAEGVESADQVEALLGLGCSLSQGFHFARPQSAAAAVSVAR